MLNTELNRTPRVAYVWGCVPRGRSPRRARWRRPCSRARAAARRARGRPACAPRSTPPGPAAARAAAPPPLCTAATHNLIILHIIHIYIVAWITSYYVFLGLFESKPLFKYEYTRRNKLISIPCHQPRSWSCRWPVQRYRCRWTPGSWSQGKHRMRRNLRI